MATIAKAYAGMIADQQTHVRLSRIAEGAITPGRAVTQGTLDGNVMMGGAGTFLGIAIADRTLSPEQSGDYSNGDTAGYAARPALIWCRVVSAVTAGEVAAFDPVTGEIGASDISRTDIDQAIFDSSAAAGSLARIRLQ